MGLGTVVAAAAGPDDEMVSDTKFYWRLLRGTMAGTFEVAKTIAVEARFTYGVLSTKAKTAVAHYRAERQWSMDDQPDEYEMPWKSTTPVWKRATGASYQCLSCRRKWTSAKALIDHQERVHGHESPAWEEEHARAARKVRRGATTKQKVRGRRARATEAAVNTAATTNGVRKMITVETSAIIQLKVGWGTFGDARPTKLSQIRADMLGMEQVFGATAAESIGNYRRRLIAIGFDPALLMHLQGAERAAEEMARRFSATIATIEEELAKDIAAAKARGKDVGSKPDDAVLAN